MPELPEVETIRRTLAPHLLGRCLAAVVVYRRDVCSTPRGVRPSDRDLAPVGAVRELRRLGKQLAIVMDRGAGVCVRLGMSGRLTWLDRPVEFAPGDHAHVVWTLADTTDRPAWLAFQDARRFGGVVVFRNAADLHRLWMDLGPDALGASARALAAAADRSKRSIKAALLDQGVLAGVGNIYADEALFAAGIRPSRACASLTDGDWDRLASCVRSTLTSAILWGGSTIRDYANAMGKAGEFQSKHAVYGRGGMVCVRCHGRLGSSRIAGRTTVWCRRCQR